MLSDHKRLVVCIAVLTLALCASIASSSSGSREGQSLSMSSPASNAVSNSNSDTKTATSKSMRRSLKIVVAATRSSLGIGKGGDLPWRLPGDMRFFKKVTVALPPGAGAGSRNCVIMGRKTYESIPEKFRPLSDRLNVVLTRNPSARELLRLPPGVLVAASLEDAIECLPAEVRSPLTNTF